MSEFYNGWSTRETWAVSLHINNCEGFQNIVTEMKDESKDVHELALKLREFFEQLESDAMDHEVNRETKIMFTDIGSLWRVDWQEVAESFYE